MCETMASAAMEENSYVLTEDMFDAAMTEQFTYQDDIESEEDISSQDGVMVMDQDIQDDHAVEHTEDTGSSKVLHSENVSKNSVIVSARSTGYNDSGMSVLVIETGLDKNKIVDMEPTASNTISEVVMEKDVQVMNTSSNAVDSRSDVVANKNEEPQSHFTSTTVQTRGEVTNKNLPILKKILSDKPFDCKINLVESIDLCDSDNDKFSDEDMSEELTDDELKSVIKNNLMAEVGFTLNSQKESNSNPDKTTQTNPLKLAVKNISQISTDVFNNISNNGESGEIVNREYIPPITKINCEMSNKTSIYSNSVVTDISARDQDQVSTIQINKIAIPHQTFVNKQGQKMVYLKKQTAIPLVISDQPKNKNLRFTMTSQAKKVPVHLAPIAALTNMTKLNMQHKPALSKPTRVLSLAPKVDIPPVLQNSPHLSRVSHFGYDQNKDFIVKSLLCNTVKKPYVPSDSPLGVTYNCMECNDKFLIQSSLTHHLARQSFIIRYWCRICQFDFEFFNRCIFMKHLRGHKSSIKHIDFSCIKFSSIGKDKIDSGLASSFFKESSNDLQNNDCILYGNSKNGQINENPTKTIHVEKVVNENGLVSTVNTLTSANKKLPSVSGQSKGVLQSTPSYIHNKSLGPFSQTQATKPMFTAIMPKTSKLPFQKQVVEKPTCFSKPGTQNVILLCNKLSRPLNPKQYSNNQNINSISPNVEEPEFKKPEINIIDHKNGTITNNNIEENDIDIDCVTIENDFSEMDCSIIEKTESEKSSSSKTKDQIKKLSPSFQKSGKRNCSECGVACINISKHLNGNNRPVNLDLSCQVCHLVLATKCALKIHLRIHMQREPYKCPDCGKDFDSWDEVHAHLKFSCGHLAKCVRYMCILCKAHFPSVGILGHHISTNHSRDIFKCKSCPVAFFNSLSLDKHMQTVHSNETDLRMDYKQCSLCPKKLVPVDKFVDHVQEHTRNNNALIYGYKCPMCTVVFANKMAFIIHQLKEKKDQEQKEGKASRTNKSIPIKIVSDSNSELEDEPEIIRKYPEISDITSATEKDPLSLEDWEATQEFTVKEKREEVCIVCKKNSVILLPNIDLNDQSLCCKQCVKPLDVTSSVNNFNLPITNRQINQMHVNNCSKNEMFNPIKRKRCLQRSNTRSSSCEEVKMAFKTQRLSVDGLKNAPENEDYVELHSEYSPNKKKNRKKLNKEKFDVAGQAHIHGQVITSNPAKELVCSKCGFVADTREIFIKHITDHKTDPTTFQCLECGLCFVVLPSLERHLQMHHNIKDVASYMRMNSSSMSSNDYLCQVCNKTFESGASLEKHFRTHGMAFMNSLSKSP